MFLWPAEGVPGVIHLSPYVSGILLVYTACALGLLSPGPNILSVVGTSMGSGRRAGVCLALGVSAGTPIWGITTSIGLTALLAAYATALIAIKIAGGSYLLWLAFKAFRSAASGADISPVASRIDDSSWRYFLRGLTIQMTNPKAALTWIAIMSLGVQDGAPHWIVIAIVAGTAFLSVIGHLIYALAFSTQRMVTAYRRAKRWIEFALGSFFCFAGVKLLTSR
jgi:amino acid exporter